MGRRRVVGLIALLLLGFASEAFAVVRAGVGFSAVTPARQVPAPELGLDFGSEWSSSVMLAGARTSVYYTTGILVNALRTKDWGDFWFGFAGKDNTFSGAVFLGDSYAPNQFRASPLRSAWG